MIGSLLSDSVKHGFFCRKGDLPERITSDGEPGAYDCDWGDGDEQRDESGCELRVVVVVTSASAVYDELTWRTKTEEGQPSVAIRALTKPSVRFLLLVKVTSFAPSRSIARPIPMTANTFCASNTLPRISPRRASWTMHRTAATMRSLAMPRRRRYDTRTSTRRIERPTRTFSHVTGSFVGESTCIVTRGTAGY